MDCFLEIQLVLSFITTICVIIALLINSHQTSLLSKQMKFTFLADYTKRYQEIILHFPENINETKFNLDIKNNKDEYDKTMRYMRAYFDLCNEEFDLYHTHHAISPQVWHHWEIGIKVAFSKTAFKSAWQIISQDSSFSEKFTSWIATEIKP